ncbi:MAG: sulfite exporter TauE/SafE family protein [Anaerolineae bacterium]|nr:sulfite exporter TauE/SafE family protein [Anaerolineae bacterium]
MILLAGLVLGAGFDLVRANAIKVVIILVFTIPALIVFVMNGQVNWCIGLILAIGNMTGAWLGAQFASRPGAAVWVHRILIAVVVVSAAKLLGLFDLAI